MGQARKVDVQNFFDVHFRRSYVHRCELARLRPGPTHLCPLG